MRSHFFRLISAAVICSFIITTCKKDHKTTEFEITDVTVTDNTVKVSGKIISLSDNPVTGFGVCYSTKSNPVATDTAVNLGTPAVGPFSATITNLKRTKTYYFRAFIKEENNYLYDDPRNAIIPAIPPAGTSKAAGNITESSATLNGSVNPNDCATNVSFEYGETTNYGNVASPEQSIVNGNTPIDVNVVINSLLPNTTYHFRIKVNNAGGIAYGEDMTFTTKINLIAPAIVSSAATNITNSSATLNASVNPNGSATKITFEYGTTFLYGTQLEVTADSLKGFVPSSASSELTGLAPGQLYHFRVRAVSAGGTTNSEDATFTTTNPPSATTLDASNLNLTTATLNGQVNANGLSTVITFEYGSTSSYGTGVDAVPAETAGSENTQVHADLTGLSQNVTYHYRIKAVSSAGTSYGTDVSFTTNPEPVLPAITTIIPSLVTRTGASAGGNITEQGSGSISSRGVCWNTTGNPSTADNKTTDGTGAGFFVSAVTGLSAGTQYYLRAYATNTAGTAYGEQVVFTTLATDPLPATLTTSAITDITAFTATGGGNITDDGGSEVVYRGICFNTATNPTIDDFKTINGTGPGIFTSPFTNLLPNTLYYVRAYATNAAGTSYGNEITFTSSPPPADLPTVTTASVTDIVSYSATGGGNVTADGGGTIIARGICWSTSEFPTTDDQKTVNGSGLGAFTGSMTSLAASTIYYVRAYATNSAGTAYGDEVSFTTSEPPAGFATLSTTTISTIKSNSAISGGNITDNGGGAITARGVCWSTSATPTVSGSFSADGIGSGRYPSFINGLSPNTKYYVRAYATNAAGTAYGNELSFTTSLPDPVLPAVSTTTPSSITHNSASGGGNVTSDGYASITERGVCWSTSENPTTDNFKASGGTGTGSYTVTMSTLSPSTTYYVRAYAINSAGTAYGTQSSFTTTAPPYVIPTLTTNSASSVTNNSASTGGNISSNGGATITLSGVCYGTAHNPTVTGNKTTDGSTSGSFTSNLSGLSASTVYYARAYATNAAGTGYGAEITFTTLAPPPDLPAITTTDISGISSIAASSGGNVTYGGTSSVTAKGVCWATTVNPTITGSKSTDGSGTGAFTSAIAGLVPCTTYHVRAYATNSTGTSYGADVMFTTSAVMPSLSTASISGITSTGAISGGTISGDCISGVTERGVCWSTSPGPTTALPTRTSNGTGGGTYTSNITGLTPCTIYYVRAYAVNSAGTVYGNEVSFTTSTVSPTITTTSVTGITTTSASSGGTISGNCQSAVTARGIVWSTSPDPTTDLTTKTVNGTGGGSFSAGMTGLTACTMYYVRAYVVNSAGTFYGNQVFFTTSTDYATVSTTAASGITSSTAVTGGNVTGLCGGTVTARGVCWNTTGSPTVAGLRTINGSGAGSFISSLSGLNYNTTYYVRAYATNSAGTVYGNEVSFTTLPVAPSVSTNSITIISATSTQAGGNVTNDGGAAVSARGVCWNTTGSPTADLSTKTSDGSGTGTFVSNISGLTAGTTYYVRAYATNSGGTGYGNQVTINVPATVTDYNGNVYKTVTISGQTWMQENLKATVYNDGSSLIMYSDSMSVGYSYYHSYNNVTSNGTTYGYMYNGFVVGGMKNICPVGWHIPTSSDWTTLTSNLGGSSVAGGKMKDLSGRWVKFPSYSFSLSYWDNSMTGHTNDSRFYGRGGGYYLNSYVDQYYSTVWWISNKQYVRIYYNNTGITTTNSTSDDNAFYIRCKKN